MGGFLGIGTPAAVKQSTGNLNNVFNYAMGTAKDLQPKGQATTQAGLDVLGKAGTDLDTASSTIGGPLAYWKQLMSGSRPAMEQAVAPETNAVQAQTDATKRQVSTMGTARGGGNTGLNRTIDSDAMAKIDNLLFGARPAAAEQVSQIGSQQAGVAGERAAIGSTESTIGQNTIEEALQALGLGTGAASNEGSIALKQEELNQSGPFQQLIADFLGGATNKAMKAIGI